MMQHFSLRPSINAKTQKARAGFAELFYFGVTLNINLIRSDPLSSDDRQAA
jgi:hypothetical protein